MGARTFGTICQLLHNLNVGGAEILAARLARQLSGQYRFVFACLDEIGSLGEELRSEGFAVYLLERHSGLDWRCALRLARVLRQENVDIIQAHQYTPFFYALLARLRYRRPAVLFTEHGRHYPDYPRRKRILANRLLLERRDRVVSVGNAVREALIQNEGIASERVRVIYNGIELSSTGHDQNSREQTRQELGLAADTLAVIQVARLDYLKDHATALATWKKVVQHRADAQLLLIGDGPERAGIEQLIEQHGLSGHVRLLGLRHDARRLLAAADIFLLTSISEGIPLTVIEAMAAAVPVVATRVGGVEEVVGPTGFLAASRDVDSLARFILQLAEHGPLRVSMGQSGKARAQAMFSESRMHAGYLDLYQEMLRVRSN
ncbi:MAG TPA: glycosyltransferase [Gemmataceae bacterium]|nr:glycosyltransferase [Gemmataceae bacterium]